MSNEFQIVKSKTNNMTEEDLFKEAEETTKKAAEGNRDSIIDFYFKHKQEMGWKNADDMLMWKHKELNKRNL